MLKENAPASFISLFFTQPANKPSPKPRKPINDIASIGIFWDVSRCFGMF
jgi:hypothetical protein